MQSTSSQENFEEKLLFFENYYNLWNIFWIQSNIFSDSCLKTFNRFVETAFHVSRRNFQNLLGKIFDCFVVFGSRTKISVISDFWTNHFGNVVKRPSRVHRKRSGKNVFFPKKLYSVFHFPWTEIYGSVSRNYCMDVRFQFLLLGGSFGESHIIEKL